MGDVLLSDRVELEGRRMVPSSCCTRSKAADECAAKHGGGGKRKAARPETKAIPFIGRLPSSNATTLSRHAITLNSFRPLVQTMAPEIIDVDAFDGPDLQITGQYRPKRVQLKAPAPVRTHERLS